MIPYSHPRIQSGFDSNCCCHTVNCVCCFRKYHTPAATTGNVRRDKTKLSIGPEVHKDTGVSQSTHDKVASLPSPHCQHVLVNQSVISSSGLYRGSVADVTQRK